MGCGLSRQKNNKIQPSSDSNILDQKVNRRGAVRINILDEIMIYKKDSRVSDLRALNSSRFVIAHRISRLIDKGKLNKMLPR